MHEGEQGYPITSVRFIERITLLWHAAKLYLTGLGFSSSNLGACQSVKNELNYL